MSDAELNAKDMLLNETDSPHHPWSCSRARQAGTRQIISNVMNFIKGELDVQENLGKVNVAFILGWIRQFLSHRIKEHFKSIASWEITIHALL